MGGGYPDMSAVGTRRSAWPQPLKSGLTVALCLIPACDGGSTPTPPNVSPPVPAPQVASIEVAPDGIDLAVGDTLTLTATARDGSGAVIPGVRFNWSSSDTAIATVANGVVTGGADGLAQIFAAAGNQDGSATVVVSEPPSDVRTTGIWISPAEVRRLPSRGSAWEQLKAAANSDCGRPDLSDQDDDTNVCVLAKALVYVRLGGHAYLDGVMDALRRIADEGRYDGRTLSLGRELAAYVFAADLIDLSSQDPDLDLRFRDRLRELLVTEAYDSGVRDLGECDERRPNNWGNHCRASRAAIAVYLNDRSLLERVAAVFKGYLGDRSAYAGFEFGDDLSWQCDPSRPVGVNPAGCHRDGHSLDGVLPDDQRRGGSFDWPPPKENYVYGGLQGALVTAVVLQREGFDAFEWEDRALLRAFTWLHEQALYPAEGDDAWQPHVINHFYGSQFPADEPALPGKGVGWTDWTLGTGSD